MKKYLNCKVYRKDGSTFYNPLLLSEIRLVIKLAKENDKVEVSVVECDSNHYKCIFGK